MVIRSCDSMVQTIASLFTGGMQICPWEFSVAGQGNSWMATTVLNVTDRETVWLLALNWYSCPFSQSVQGLAKLDQGTSPRHLDKAAHFRLHTWGLKRAFQGDDIQNLRILNKVECSPCKGEQETCLEEIPFSAQLSQSCLGTTTCIISLQWSVVCFLETRSYVKFLMLFQMHLTYGTEWSWQLQRPKDTGLSDFSPITILRVNFHSPHLLKC